ncbi:conserved hypothetical protein [Paecilomyces variotii No. 5]|uniref:TM7S3/TM198-like domain-containing protein n=1 Tax=Byssochlamys spectabilis (strain No. 5 / NBRC 109023) TaxID=1356009 RepID=V5I312_BYSSN|nr:conserved hypothetical protein [Paecilomyces variotii No. 5]
MRCRNLFLVICCIAFAFLALAEDVTTTSASASASSTISATDSDKNSQSASATDAARSSDSAPSAASTASATSKIDHAATTNSSTPTSTIAANATAPTSSSDTVDGPRQDPNVLPFRPKITPAVGIAGVILIILGGIYALIGVKNRRLHIFLSTAFLTGLGVLVLIEYVMSPPVTDAVQGAYFVAVFVTGAIFGALALVFSEITEGLGCLLGGFCLSMWLLELRPGGLVSSSGSKGAFIGAFSAGIYAVSFSHYTRPYGLVVATSFAGATAVVLGIDCFSRAGLKEFWLYLWDLNGNTFPLNTNTYPVTRGIKVEIALTMIIFTMGLISQFRLWKVVKERRKQQEMIRSEEDRKREEHEAELGRQIEEANMRDREIWESVYGNKDAHPSDSGIGTDVSESPRKRSTAIETSEIDPNDDSENGQRSYRNSNETGSGIGNDPEQAHDEVRDDPHHVSDEYVNELPGDFPPSSNEHPTVVPLPFKIPEEEKSTKDDDEGSVAATLAGSDILERRLSTRLSKSGAPNPVAISESEEALVATKDDTPASSVAGVPDDDDRDMISDASDSPADNEADESNENNAIPAEIEGPSHQNATNEKPASESEGQSESTYQSMGSSNQISDVDGREGKKTPDAADVLPARQVLSLLPVSSPAPTTKQSASERDDKSYSHEGAAKAPSRTASGKQEGQSSARKASLTADTVTQLPDRVSRVLSSYRTNEWAKHLCDAEVPEAEPIEPIIEDKPLDDGAKEAAAPVQVEELLQTPLTAQRPPAISIPNDMEHQYGLSNSRSLSNRSKSKSPKSVSPEPPRDLTGSRRASTGVAPPPLTPLLRSGSNASLTSQHSVAHPGYRRHSSSQLLSNTLAATPIDESKEVDFQNSGYGKGPQLMAQRQSLIKNRVSSTPLSRDSWMTRSASASRQSLGLGISSPQFESQVNLADDDDDMPLAKRRDMIQRQQLSPSRTDATGAAWRESIRQDLARTTFPYSSAAFSRSEHDQAWTVRHQQMMAANHMDQAIAHGMQRGELRDLHREAMRRMQAAAYRAGN